MGVTLLTSVFTGVHVGTTLKFLRGRVEHTTGGAQLTPEALLDLGDDATGGGVAVAVRRGRRRAGRDGAHRAWAASSGTFARPSSTTGPARTSSRCGCRGRRGSGWPIDGALRRTKASPWVVSADVDVVRYTTGTGDRRVIAAGAERWLFGKRLGIRGGGRFNQVGHNERSATAGVSAAIRPGILVEAHAVAGGSDDERGWGVAVRMSF